MSAYDPSAWSDLFVATAGATAALSGLVFVAVSINIGRILENEGVPDFALVTLLLLVGSLIAGSGGGLYWIVAGFIATIFAAVANAWILLVEILR